MAAYFGFGALMNTVSVRMRNIHPQSSCAAKLSGFRLVFGGSHGMATVLPSSDDVVHGVLHMVTEEEKLRLDNTESSYEELKTQVETGALVAGAPTNPYSSTAICKSVFASGWWMITPRNIGQQWSVYVRSANFDISLYHDMLIMLPDVGYLRRWSARLMHSEHYASWRGKFLQLDFTIRTLFGRDDWGGDSTPLTDVMDCDWAQFAGGYAAKQRIGLWNM